MTHAELLQLRAQIAAQLRHGSPVTPALMRRLDDALAELDEYQATVGELSQLAGVLRK